MFFQQSDGGFGDGGKPVVVFIKDQKDADGYLYGGRDSEGDDEEEEQRGGRGGGEGGGGGGGCPQGTYSLRSVDAATDTMSTLATSNVTLHGGKSASLSILDKRPVAKNK